MKTILLGLAVAATLFLAGCSTQQAANQPSASSSAQTSGAAARHDLKGELR